MPRTARSGTNLCPGRCSTSRTGSEQGENIVQHPANQQSHFDVIAIDSSGAPTGNETKFHVNIYTAPILGSSNIIDNRSLQPQSLTNTTYTSRHVRTNFAYSREQEYLFSWPSSKSSCRHKFACH